MQSGGQHAKELPAQNPPQMAQRAEVAPSESGGVAPAAQVKPTIREILSIPNFELKRIKLEALVIMTTTEMKQMEENLQVRFSPLLPLVNKFGGAGAKLF